MELTVGSIHDGKVTGITKFGAFVSFSEGKTGMVHISEISHTYVNEISEHLKEGQEVKVKVINIDDSGRVNLSIKKTQTPKFQKPNVNNFEKERKKPVYREQKSEPLPATFEDKLKLFMQDSESRMADIKHNMDKKSGRKRK